MNYLRPTIALLLDLLGDKARIDPATITALSPADWEHIDRMPVSSGSDPSCIGN